MLTHQQAVGVAVALLAGSELLTLLPCRSNGWVQLFIAALRGIASLKK